MTQSPAARPIFVKLTILGLVAVGMIVWSLFWLTGRINAIEREATRDLVELMVTETVDRVQASTEDYAYWTLAYDVVTAGDEAAIYEHMGSGAAESDLFDQLLILSADHDILHHFGSDDGSTLPAPTTVGDLQAFLIGLEAQSPSDFVSMAGIGRVGDVHAAITAAWITPDELDPAAAENLPILVGVIAFDDDKLQTIERMTQGTGYAIRNLTEAAEPPLLPLSGPDGAPVAQLVWTPLDIGTELRTNVMPFILVVCAGIFALCLSAARYFHDQSQLLEQAHKVAMTDELTGLLNRSGLDRVLQTSSLRTAIRHGHIALLYLDLNAFKALNDTYGHTDGDRALKITAQRLQGAVRAADHVVRLGGDEFACLVVDDDPKAAAELVAGRIIAAFDHPMRFADHESALRPSLGIAVGAAGVDWETLLNQADAAMYLAKRTGSDAPMMFSKAVADALRSETDKAGNDDQLARADVA